MSIPDDQNSHDTADVVIRPPVLFGSGLGAAMLLELIWPLGPGLAGGSLRPIAIGLAFLAGGVFIAWRAVTRFREKDTTVPIGEPTNALVTEGIFRISRNPIYIALITAFFGLSLALTTVWGLLILPFLVCVLHTGVVLREEAFLEAKFGDAYRAYMAKVPRWL